MLRAFGRKRVAPKERGDNMAPAAKKFVLRPSMDGDEGVWSRYIDGSIANTSFSSEVVSMTPISTTATFTEPITQSGITDAEEANSDRLMELTMVKGVTGFGFLIEGGIGSPLGDVPVKIKKYLKKVLLPIVVV